MTVIAKACVETAVDVQSKMQLQVTSWNRSVKCVFVLQQRMAQEVLTHLKEHPDAWTRVDTILEFSQNMNTKVSKLQSRKHWWKDTYLCFEEDVSEKQQNNNKKKQNKQTKKKTKSH